MQCKIIGNLYNTINNIKLRQKEPMILKGIDGLNKADIKFIDTISLNLNQNATTLATILNVSRGAITQIVNRLEQIDVVERVPVKGNRKEKII
ncbi:MAG: MarR family transcriptional regulator, partial [Erysipelotrichaceae bacterium]